MNGAFTADFLFSIEKEMKVLNERGYMKMLAAENTWYPKVLRQRPLGGKSERITWLLSTASIEQVGPADGGETAGTINFDQLATITTEYFPAMHRKGTKINKMKYLNMLQGGVNPLARWSEDIGTYGAYYPQRLLAQLMLNGANVNAYDGVAFWSTAHLVHPLISALGTYANVFTGAASGAYPGACPIDDTQTLDVALTNLSKIFAYITGAIPQPNGAGDPRFLEPAYIIYPTRMKTRVLELLNADFIAQPASGGAGSADIREVWRKFRLAEPLEAKELGGGVSYTIPNQVTGGTSTLTGSDTTFYVVCREAAETELGAFIENRRLPFSLHTYTGESGSEGVDAVLGRSQDIEYHYDGYTAVNLGHPYAIFQCKGS